MKAHINQTVTCEGEYTLEVYRPDGTLKRKVGPFKNLITDQGLNSFGESGGGSYTINHCIVGTGTTTPLVTDTAMATYKAASATQQTIANSSGGAPDYYGQLSRTVRFAAGVATGNLTEVGVGQLSNLVTPVYTLLFSRALIVDSGGSPIAITVLADEYLDVTYTIRKYPKLTDTVSTIVDSSTGISHTFTHRLMSAGSVTMSSSGTLLPVATVAAKARSVAGTPITLSAITATAMTGSTANGVGTTVQVAYSSGSLTKNTTVNFALGESNNVNGIEGLETTSTGIGNLYSQILIAPPIMKTASKTLTMRLTTTWARRP